MGHERARRCREALFLEKYTRARQRASTLCSRFFRQHTAPTGHGREDWYFGRVQKVVPTDSSYQGHPQRTARYATLTSSIRRSDVGCVPNSALAMGTECFDEGCVVVGEHQRSLGRGGVCHRQHWVRALNQIAVAFGQAAISHKGSGCFTMGPGPRVRIRPQNIKGHRIYGRRSIGRAEWARVYIQMLGSPAPSNSVLERPHPRGGDLACLAPGVSIDQGEA